MQCHPYEICNKFSSKRSLAHPLESTPCANAIHFQISHKPLEWHGFTKTRYKRQMHVFGWLEESKRANIQGTRRVAGPHMVLGTNKWHLYYIGQLQKKLRIHSDSYSKYSPATQRKLRRQPRAFTLYKMQKGVQSTRNNDRKWRVRDVPRILRPTWTLLLQVPNPPLPRKCANKYCGAVHGVPTTQNDLYSLAPKYAHPTVAWDHCNARPVAHTLCNSWGEERKGMCEKKKKNSATAIPWRALERHGNSWAALGTFAVHCPTW